MGFVDENDLKIIEESLNQVMVKALIGQVPKRFEGLSKEQIKVILIKENRIT